ncbi:MAG: hypothetical protein P4M02_06915 [Clostridia bacterium]|nr:hypothetical protein [Clostridia bacterium]
MGAFNASRLRAVADSAARMLPLPADIVRGDEEAQGSLAELVSNFEGSGILKIPARLLDYAFNIASSLDERDYARLRRIVEVRAGAGLFRVGLRYFEENPDDGRAGALLELCVQWAKANSPALFEGTPFALLECPVSELAQSIAGHMPGPEEDMRRFFDSYGVVAGTAFWQRTLYAYFTTCEPGAVTAQSSLFIEFAQASRPEYLLPCLANYAKLRLTKMDDRINSLIVDRFGTENEHFGMEMQEKLRRWAMLHDLAGRLGSRRSLPVYAACADWLIDIDTCEDGSIHIDFGACFVVEPPEGGKAFLYRRRLYLELMRKWEENGSPEGFWPLPEGYATVTARDMQLGIDSAEIARLDFSETDLLYAVDIIGEGMKTKE